LAANSTLIASMRRKMKKSTKKYMKTQIKNIVIYSLTLFVLCLSGSASAQAGKKAAPSSSSTVNEEIKKMDFLVGKWEGTLKSETGPVVVTKSVKVTYEVSKIMKGTALKVVATRQTVGESKVIEETGIIGFDTASKELHFFALNTVNETFDFKGKWTNMKSMNFTYEGKRGGQKLLVNFSLIKKSQDELELKNYATFGEDLLITTEGFLSRKAAPAADVQPPVKKSK